MSTQPIVDAALAFLQALDARSAPRAIVPHGRHRVADVDQRPHEPLPPRRHARGPHASRCATSPSASCGPRCPHAASTRPARSCGSTSCSPSVTGDHEAFGEWPYFVSIFGTPGPDEPWGWQIDGHHVCVNTVVFDGRIVTTPTFMGAEPRRVRHGPYAGISLFDPEEALGLDLIRSFDAAQRARAIDLPVAPPRRDPDPPAEPVRRADRRPARSTTTSSRPYQGVAGAEHDRRAATPAPGADRHLRRLDRRRPRRR